MRGNASMPHAARLAALFGDKAIVRRTPKRSMRLRRLMELAPKIFGRDSPLEGAGLEPSVPRDTPKFSTPAHVTCFTSCTRKSRREREPILRGCGPPPAEPMVRIRLPPAESQANFRPRRLRTLQR